MGAKVTARERFRLQDERLAIWTEQGGICATCGRQMPWPDGMEVAHCIADTATNRKVYGKEVVNHRRNKRGVCRDGWHKGVRCNDACNLGNKPGTAWALARSILLELAGLGGG